MTNHRRILFALWDGGGTVPPELAIAAELVRRGHDVTVIGDAVLAEEVAAAGAEHVAWSRAPQRHGRGADDDFIKDWEVKTPAKLFGRLRERFLCGPADDFAADVREELRRRPADVLVANQFLFGAQIGAEAEGVPVVLLLPNIYGLPGSGQPPAGTGFRPARGAPGRIRDRVVHRMTESMFDKGLEGLNEVRTAHGLRPLDHTLDQIRRHRLLLLVEEAFDFPGTLPPTATYAGAQLDDPAWAQPWEPPAGDEPLVLVALSSTYQAQEAVLRRIATALGRLPVRGLVTTGPAIDPALVPAPPNVVVTRSAPHSEILRHAAAVVTHGGHGSVAKALAAGVPLVVLPMGRDQGDNAARVAAHGAGIRLKASSSEHAIERAVRAVLHGPAYRAAAERLGEAIRANAGPARAVAEIESVAAAACPA